MNLEVDTVGQRDDRHFDIENILRKVIVVDPLLQFVGSGRKLEKVVKIEITPVSYVQAGIFGTAR